MSTIVMNPYWVGTEVVLYIIALFLLKSSSKWIRICVLLIFFEIAALSIVSIVEVVKISGKKYRLYRTESFVEYQTKVVLMETRLALCACLIWTIGCMYMDYKREMITTADTPDDE